MSKERLDDIVDGLLNNRLELTSFVSESLEQAERVQELERDYKFGAEQMETLVKNHNRLDSENKRYREALEFYAGRGHYIASGYPNTELQAIEYGEIARKALEGEE